MISFADDANGIDTTEYRAKEGEVFVSQRHSSSRYVFWLGAGHLLTTYVVHGFSFIHLSLQLLLIFSSAGKIVKFLGSRKVYNLQLNSLKTLKQVFEVLGLQEQTLLLF